MPLAPLKTAPGHPTAAWRSSLVSRQGTGAQRQRPWTPHSRPGGRVGGSPCVPAPRTLGPSSFTPIPAAEASSPPLKAQQEDRVRWAAVKRAPHGDPRPRCVASGESFPLCGPQFPLLCSWEGAGGLSGPLHFALPIRGRSLRFWGVYQLPLVETPVVLGLDQGTPSSRMLSVLQVGKLRLWEQRD